MQLYMYLCMNAIYGYFDLFGILCVILNSFAPLWLSGNTTDYICNTESIKATLITYCTQPCWVECQSEIALKSMHFANYSEKCIFLKLCSFPKMQNERSSFSCPTFVNMWILLLSDQHTYNLTLLTAWHFLHSSIW